MLHHLKPLTAVMRDEAGVTALEYGLIMGIIALVILSAYGRLTTNLNSMFNSIAGHLG